MQKFYISGIFSYRFCGQFLPITCGCTQVSVQPFPTKFLTFLTNMYVPNSTLFVVRSWTMTWPSTLASVSNFILLPNIPIADSAFLSEGYFNVCCCVKAGSCGEQSCPDLCLFCEACVCNFAAVSASRMYVMEKYDLTSDPCDYRLIRINNCLQMLACVCSVLAIFIAELRELAR